MNEDRHEIRNESREYAVERGLGLLLEQILLEVKVLHSTQGTMVRALTTIIAQGEAQMAVSQAVIDALAKLDKATNDIAAKLQTLADQIKVGMTQADVDSVVGSINTEADKLEGLAADPANPVP